MHTVRVDDCVQMHAGAVYVDSSGCLKKRQPNFYTQQDFPYRYEELSISIEERACNHIRRRESPENPEIIVVFQSPFIFLGISSLSLRFVRGFLLTGRGRRRARLWPRDFCFALFEGM